jgi:hypothetical protein
MRYSYWATGWTNEEKEFDSQKRKQVFLFSETSRGQPYLLFNGK